MWAAIKKIDWSFLPRLGILGVAGFIWRPEFKLFFLLYLLSFFPFFNRSAGDEQEMPGTDLSRYYQTMALSQINPFTLFMSVMQVFGQFIILLKNMGRLPGRESYLNTVEYMPPFEGEWLAMNGGSTRENSHSWNILTQRYAYDFIICDDSGSTHGRDGKHPDDYYCFGRRVLSPADGAVVKVRDGIRDYEGVGDYSIDWKVRDFRGNFVIIQHAPKEYSFIAHLQCGSIMVREGENVRSGQPVALCGNSGHSTEPHIHFHLQDSENFWTATGLPIRFTKIAVRTGGTEARIKEHDFAEKGEYIANLQSGNSLPAT